MRRAIQALFALPLLLALACGRGHDPASPAFTLAVEPAQIRLLPGLSRTVAITLQPDAGFNGKVELSASGLGPGVTAQFSPASVTLADGIPGKSTLELTATENAPTGHRVLAIESTGNGHSLSTEMALEIPLASFFTVMTYLGVEPANFAFLAYQDGDGPWTSVPGRGGLYRLPVTDAEGRFGVLLGEVCQGGSSSTWITNGFFSTVGEVQTLQAMAFCNFQPGPPPEQFDLRGALAGTAGQRVLISANSGLWEFPQGATDYAMKLTKGTGDLVAATYDSTDDYIPSRVILERGRAAEAAGTRNFDFAAQGDAPLPRVPIQRSALGPGEDFLGTVQYQTARGQTVFLGYGRDLPAYAPFPPSAAQPGDSYSYRFQAGSPSHSRVVQAFGGEPPGPLAPQLPSGIPPFEATFQGDGNPHLALAWETVSPSPAVHEILLTQQRPGRQLYAYLYFGRTWHRGAARLAWTQPDLSAVPGYDPNFLPQPGTDLQVAIHQSGTQSTGSLTLETSRFLAGKGPLLSPPGIAPPFTSHSSPAGIRLKALGPAALAAAATTWTEYWSSSRTQTLKP